MSDDGTLAIYGQDALTPEVRLSALAAARAVREALVLHPFDASVVSAMVDLVESSGVGERDAVLGFGVDQHPRTGVSTYSCHNALGKAFPVCRRQRLVPHLDEPQAALQGAFQPY